MRIHALSDLHLEMGGYEETPPTCDLVLLAGDTWTRTRGPAWARSFFGDAEIVYVPGNHEYYGGALPREDEKLEAACRDHGIHFLQARELVLDGVRFLGATLWTDFALLGLSGLGRTLAGECMNDYRKIRVSPGGKGAGGYRRLRPTDTEAVHWRHRRWLEARLAEPFSGPTVVVTHHAPTERTTHPAFRGSELNVAYASRLEELILRYEPDVWVHGHSHFSTEEWIGPTRVASNARGYVGVKSETGFDPTWTFELP